MSLPPMDIKSRLEGSSRPKVGPTHPRKSLKYIPNDGAGEDPLPVGLVPRGPSSPRAYSFLSVSKRVQQMIEDPLASQSEWTTDSSWSHLLWNRQSSGHSTDSETEDIDPFPTPYPASRFHARGYNKFLSGQLTQKYSSGSIHYIVKALVGPDIYRIRYPIDALPDTGAKRNFVSQQLVDSLGLVPNDVTGEKFQLPSGATIKSCGTVNIPFTFCGETKHRLISCCILPACTHDLILSQSFLRITGTLTKYAHRIKKLLRNLATRLRFNLMEGDRGCFQGSFDGIPSFALADTGSDAMLISADFASRNSLKVDDNSEHRRTIEYADGSLDTTAGIIRCVTWQFPSSQDKFTCDFYVLGSLKIDIVLSSHFIMEHKVFSKFAEDMVDSSVHGPDLADINNIRLISHYSPALQTLEDSAITDMILPRSSSLEAIKKERVRRDQIRDAINALPLDQQDQARIAEGNRQEIWEKYRRGHLETEGGLYLFKLTVMVERKDRWWRNRPFWSRLKRYKPGNSGLLTKKVDGD